MRGGELGVEPVVDQRPQPAGRIKHGDVDAFDIHRFELDFGSPAARRIVAEDILFFLEVFTARGIVLRRGFARHSVPSGCARRRSRTFLLVMPRGARALNLLSIYFSHRSGGSMICMSLSNILNAVFCQCLSI